MDRTVSSSANFAHQLGSFDAFEALNGSASPSNIIIVTHIQSTFKATSYDTELVLSAELNEL
jgi:hypothetical protein